MEQTTHRQMSESFRLGAVLALTGGFLDAYTYLIRGGVFANAQTGNIVLLGVRLMEGDWGGAGHYLVPILAFAAGVLAAELIRGRFRGAQALHWRQITVALEALVLISVGFMPQSLNLLANSLTSLACGIQVESFRKIHGSGIATTMCIGNLRSATQNLSEFLHTRDRGALRKSGLYYFIILCFIVGAILGNLAVGALAEKAIFIAPAILVIAFIMMFIDLERRPRSA